jgi:hypothetical protein
MDSVKMTKRAISKKCSSSIALTMYHEILYQNRDLWSGVGMAQLVGPQTNDSKGTMV